MISYAYLKTFTEGLITPLLDFLYLVGLFHPNLPLGL